MGSVPELCDQRAGGTHVMPSAYADDAIRVEVVDDGCGGAVDPSRSGHGLLGMHERAVLYGGHLIAGPEPGGGFAVRVDLPVAR